MSIEGTAAEPAERAPTLLKNRFEVGERVAEGTFFFTHRGRDQESGRPIAIKVLRPEYSTDQAFTERLLAEAKTAVTLRHPGIAQVYDAWAEYGTVLIIAEWVRGINLKDRIRRVAPFPVTVALDIFQACAEALQYAHDAGRVHGDIRPENIVITPDGRVKISDFGVGTSAPASSRIQLGALSHSAHYLAPELVEGKGLQPQSDLYALGCILFEMLTGFPPFDAEAPLALAVKHVQEPAPSAKRLQPEIPTAVDGLVRKCMQKPPTERYADARELLTDVQRIQEALRTDRGLNWSPMPSDSVTERPRRSADEKAIANGGSERPIGPPIMLPRLERKPRAPKPAKEKPDIERVRTLREDTGPSWKLLLGVAALGLVLLGGAFGFVALWSRPPDTVTIPTTLVGSSRGMAESSLERLGLKPDVREEFNEKVPEGTVYEIEPRAGMDIRVGKTVMLHVSKGAQPASVPDVVGKTLTAATKEIKANGLVMGQTREEFSEVIDKGLVIAQSPLGATEAKKKSAVDVVVSKGPEPNTEPPPVDVNPEPAELPTPATTPPPAGDTPAADLPSRDMIVKVQVPRKQAGAQKVEIRVRNEDGSEQSAYEEEHQPGDLFEQTVTVIGNLGKCQIRVYINGRLVKRENV
jgi:serine/threonine-protein kinase